MTDINKTLSIEHSAIKLEGNGDSGIFEGYASVFNNTDSDGDIILPGAFKNVLEKQTRKIAMFFNHRTWEIPVGKWEKIKEDDHGLFVRGQLTPGHDEAKNLLSAMKHGTVEGMSIGFSVVRDDFDISHNGGYIFKNITRLREISVCTFPSNEQAGVSAIKNVDGIETVRDIERWLRESVGLSKSQAVGLVARFKSAIRSESECSQNKTDITALLQRITEFPQSLGQ